MTPARVSVPTGQKRRSEILGQEGVRRVANREAGKGAEEFFLSAFQF